MPGSIITCNTVCYTHIYKDTVNGYLTAVRGCADPTDDPTNNFGEPELEDSLMYNLGKLNMKILEAEGSLQIVLPPVL